MILNLNVLFTSRKTCVKQVLRQVQIGTIDLHIKINDKWLSNKVFLNCGCLSSSAMDALSVLFYGEICGFTVYRQSKYGVTDMLQNIISTPYNGYCQRDKEYITFTH